MTLTIVAAKGHAAWWTWVIRDDYGTLIEESKTQYRSAANAETQGRARFAEIERWGLERLGFAGPEPGYLTGFTTR